MHRLLTEQQLPVFRRVGFGDACNGSFQRRTTLFAATAPRNCMYSSVESARSWIILDSILAVKLNNGIGQ